MNGKQIEAMKVVVAHIASNQTKNAEVLSAVDVLKETIQSYEEAMAKSVYCGNA